MRRALRPAAGPAATQQQQQRAPADSTAAGSAEGADGSAEGFAGQLHASLELVLLSADRHALTTAVRGARGRPWRVELQRRVNVGGLDGLLLGARLAAAAPGHGDAGSACTERIRYQSLRPLPLKYLR